MITWLPKIIDECQRRCRCYNSACVHQSCLDLHHICEYCKKKKKPKKHVAVLERAQSAEGISHGEKPHETLKGQIEFNTRKNKQNDYQQASQELLCPSISGMETEASV